MVDECDSAYRMSDERVMRVGALDAARTLPIASTAPPQLLVALAIRLNESIWGEVSPQHANVPTPVIHTGQLDCGSE